MKALTYNSSIQLLILRVGVATTILAKIYAEFGQLDMLYSKNGIIQQILSKPLQVSYSLSLPKIVEFFHIQDERQFLQYLYILFGIMAVFLCMGFLTKLSASVCLIIHMLVFNGYNLLAFGFDGFLFSLLFYTLIFPVQKVHSLDNLIFKRDHSIVPERLNLYLTVLQLHLCVVYFTAGYSKLGGIEWMNGTAIWSAINQPQFYSDLTPFAKLLISKPGVSALFSWGTLFVETLFPVLIFLRYKRINQGILIGVLLMHVFIGAVMGLQLFAWTMIVFDLSAFAGVFLQKRTAEAEALQSDKISEYMYLTGKR